jgi:hypothetical protein
MIHPIINLGALAQVLIEARVLPESARHNRKKITAALMKSISEWHG